MFQWHTPDSTVKSGVIVENQRLHKVLPHSISFDMEEVETLHLKLKFCCQYAFFFFLMRKLTFLFQQTVLNVVLYFLITVTQESIKLFDKVINLN